MKKLKVSWKSVAVGAGAVILLSAGIASAKSQSSLSLSLQALKDELSQLKEMQSILDSFFAPAVKAPVKAPVKLGNPQDLSFGATYANPSIAETSMTESSSSPCPLQNTDGVDRIIDRIKVFFNPDDNTIPFSGANSTGTQIIGGLPMGANMWDMSTSSNSGTTSSQALQLFKGIPFTSTTRQIVFVTSTFAGQNSTLGQGSAAWFVAASSSFNNAMQWKNNEFVNLVFAQPTSSTGFCAIQYHNK